MENSASFGDLLKRAASGDPKAAAELVREYETELRRFVRFRLTDPSLRRFLDSLDVCQSVLAAFFVHLQAGTIELSDPKQLMKLLRVMAQNKVRDQIRKDRAERRGGERAAKAVREGIEFLPANAPSPGDAFVEQEIVQAVRQRLSEPERDLLERWMAGQEWDSIAAEIGGTAEALRKRLSRSIDRAAAELGLLEDRA